MWFEAVWNGTGLILAEFPAAAIAMIPSRMGGSRFRCDTKGSGLKVPVHGGHRTAVGAFDMNTPVTVAVVDSQKTVARNVLRYRVYRLWEWVRDTRQNRERQGYWREDRVDPSCHRGGVSKLQPNSSRTCAIGPLAEARHLNLIDSLPEGLCELAGGHVG